MTMPLYLEVFREDELLERREFEQKVIKIGKLASAHVRIDDDDISRVHAVIEASGPDDLYVIDMGSAKGTVVNGKKVTTKCKLSEGDEITLGRIRIIVHTDAEAAGFGAAAAAADEEEPPTEEEGGAEGADEEEPPTESEADEEEAAPAAEEPPTEVEEPEEEAADEDEAPAEPDEAPAPATASGEPPAGEAYDDEHDDDEGYDDAYDDDYNYEDYDPETTLTEEDLEAVEDHKAGEVLQIKMFWRETTMGVHHFDPKKTHVVTVGEDRKANFYVPTETHIDLWPLAKADSGEAILVIGKGMTGYVERGGEKTTVETLVKDRKAKPSGEGEGLYEYSLPAGATAEVSYGEVRFELRFVVPGRKIVVPWWTSVDWAVLQTFVLAAAAEIALIGLAFTFPPDADTLSLDLFSTPNRFVKFIIQPPKEKANKKLSLGKKPGTMGNAGRYKGKEGRAGDKKKPIKKKKLSSEDIKKWLEATKKARDTKVAKSKGILKILSNSGGGSGLSSVFGRSGLSGDIDRALGGMAGGSGTGHSDLGGYGGLGERGTGAGGGGTGDLIGLGRLGTAGRGGDGDGYGYGAGQMGRKGERGVSVETGQAVIMGALSREIIKRVISSHRAQIKYCYDRELVRTKGLFGKIIVSFTIQPSGRVSVASVASSTMNNRNVESCVVSRIKTWRFPKPKGGGIVLVKYPFIFKTAGG